jgi:hypothetical protein
MQLVNNSYTTSTMRLLTVTLFLSCVTCLHHSAHQLQQQEYSSSSLQSFNAPLHVAATYEDWIEDHPNNEEPSVDSAIPSQDTLVPDGTDQRGNSRPQQANRSHIRRIFDLRHRAANAVKHPLHTVRNGLKVAKQQISLAKKKYYTDSIYSSSYDDDLPVVNKFDELNYRAKQQQQHNPINIAAIHDPVQLAQQHQAARQQSSQHLNDGETDEDDEATPDSKHVKEAQQQQAQSVADNASNAAIQHDESQKAQQSIDHVDQAIAAPSVSTQTAQTPVQSQTDAKQ